MNEKTYTIENHPRPSDCLKWARENLKEYYTQNFNDLQESCTHVQNEVGGTFELSRWNPKTGEGFELHWKGHDEKKLFKAFKTSIENSSIFWIQLIFEGLILRHFKFLESRVIEEETYSNTDEALTAYLSDQVFNVKGEMLKPWKKVHL